MPAAPASPHPGLVSAVVEARDARRPELSGQLLVMSFDVSNAGGAGVERFYERFGYTIVGRHPGAIRLAPGEDRCELILIFRL